MGLVPHFHEADHVNFPVALTGKRMTPMACIALNGSFLKPMVIVPRKMTANDLVLTALTSEKVIVKSQRQFGNARLPDGRNICSRTT
jgi:hypothetical protein